MKEMKHILLALLAVSAAATGCKTEDYDDGTTPVANTAYIGAAETTPDAPVTFKRTVQTLDREFTVKLVTPLSEAVDVEFRIDAEAVSAYNRRHGTSYGLLESIHYNLAQQSVSIEAGKVESDPVTIRFQGLDQLEMNETYLLPVSLTSTSNGLGLLRGSETLYYLVKRSSAITTAADLTDCYMWVPTFETQEGQAPIMGLKAMTYEVLVNVPEFATSLPGQSTVNVTSVMGVEQHCLLRIGDASYPRQQIQLQVGDVHFPDGGASNVIPELTLDPGEWYHIAFTWDIEAEIGRIYVNGRLAYSDRLPCDTETFDIGQVSKGGAEDKAYRFLIGYSYNPYRPLNGMVSEARIWSVARSEEEIFRDMYEIADPASKPELRAYWKFNEGTGNIAKDYSQYGNDAACLDGSNSMENGERKEGTLKWNNAIEIPMLNQEE